MSVVDDVLLIIINGSHFIYAYTEDRKQRVVTGHTYLSCSALLFPHQWKGGCIWEEKVIFEGV